MLLKRKEVNKKAFLYNTFNIYLNFFLYLKLKTVKKFFVFSSFELKIFSLKNIYISFIK